MRIGIANIYAFRPHTQQALYLAYLFEKDGVQTSYLICPGSKDICYPKLLKGSNFKECVKCTLGGLGTHKIKNKFTIGSYSGGKIRNERVKDALLSSAATLLRVESQNDWQNPEIVEVQRLLIDNYLRTYYSTLEWIEKDSLNAIIAFNGRMDMPRAVIDAAQTAEIPYITHERTWFGHGIQLIPNANCISNYEIHRIHKEFIDRPLKFNQALLAANEIAKRIRKENDLEWRIYNRKARSIKWPIASENKEKVLILPSSRNEFAGHEEWITPWADNTIALDLLIESVGFSPDQMVVRGHPNWSEKIGIFDGEKPAKLYKDWTKKKRIFYIEPQERAETLSLIQEADLIILNGSSAVIEAAFYGKKIISLGKSAYMNSPFHRLLLTEDDIKNFRIQDLKVNRLESIRSVLRFLYVATRRFPQYVDYVMALSTTHYRFFAGADASKLHSAIKYGEIEPDDGTYATDSLSEDSVIGMILNEQWDDVLEEAESIESVLYNGDKIYFDRKSMYKWVDLARTLQKRGDR